MPIEGPLRELALTDVLQLLGLSRKTGTLSVWREGGDTPAVVYLDQGAVVGVRSPDHARRVGDLLMLAGKVTAAQLQRAAERQRREPERRLGAILVEHEGVAGAEVERQLRFQVEELVFDLVRWTHGHFRFEEASPFDGGPVRVRFATEWLLMEAARRADEFAELTRALPEDELVPQLAEITAMDGVLQLQPVEWEVLAAIDGERSLRGIAREVGRAEFDVAKSVFSLVDAGVVTLGKRHPAAPPQRDGARAELEEVERALEHGRLDDADRLLVQLAREGATAADLDVLRARALAARGDPHRARALLEAAVQRDPLHVTGYFHLARVAVRVGDLARAEEALATYLRLPDPESRRREQAQRAADAVAALRDVFEEVV